MSEALIRSAEASREGSKDSRPFGGLVSSVFSNWNYENTCYDSLPLLPSKIGSIVDVIRYCVSGSVNYSICT